MIYWETIHTEECDGFEIVCSVAPEDCHPRDCFDDSVDDIEDICDKIDRGLLAWFVARVEAKKEGVTLGAACLGGNLYDSASNFVKESGGYYDDMVHEAITEAKARILRIAA